MKTKLQCLALLTLLLTVAGCVSTSTNQALGVPTFPPTDPASVQILTTPPTRPHVRLGEIQAVPPSDGTAAAKITAALQKAGAKLGADAVVIVSDRNQVTGALVTGPWYGRSVQAIDQRVIVGVAIKYQ